MKDINIAIANECKSIAVGPIIEENSRGFNLEMAFHVSNEKVLTRPTARTFKVGSITDASEVIAVYYNEDFNVVLEKINRLFFLETDIYEPVYLHFMTKNILN